MAQVSRFENPRYAGRTVRRPAAVIWFAAMLLAVPALRAETAVEAWAQRYSNVVDSHDEAKKVVTDSTGIIVAGNTEDGVNGPDMLIIKYSSAGVALWTNRYDGPGNHTDRPLTSRSIAAVGDGSVVVVGRSPFGGHLDYATVEYVTVPQLAIALTSTNTAKISWPFPSTGFNLQQNTNLNTTNWISLPETVSSDAATRFIIVNPPTGNRFYRLSTQ